MREPASDRRRIYVEPDGRLIAEPRNVATPSPVGLLRQVEGLFRSPSVD